MIGMDLSDKNQEEMQKTIEVYKMKKILIKFLLKEGKAGEFAIQLFQTIKTCKIPIICKINGPVLGGYLK